MKKELISLFTQMSKEQFENLTTVVKETLATSYNLPSGKKFTTADLWNIQLQGKTRIQRRLSL